MPHESSCPLMPPAAPVTLIIFGGTGDLALRKIYPALSSLCRASLLSPETRILAVGRKNFTTETFTAHLAEKLSGTIPSECLTELSLHISYLQLNPDHTDAGQKLATKLQNLGPGSDTQNKLFYLAVPPGAYTSLATLIGEAGLAKEQNGASVRLVVEKPFGRDLATARDLDATLHKYFNESQIFRIDHYMAKETVQNVLLLRFANAMFEPLWNRRYIDHIRITASETLGIGHRAEFYDQAGVLRDMFQNHMMMLLALCAMEPPSLFEAELVREERSKVYRALRPFDLEHIDDHLVLGQYGPGLIDGKLVPGYIQEPGINPTSTTPTFAWMKIFLDNWRWQGVPFYITSGKRLDRKHTEIEVQFKSVPVSMFRNTHGASISPNKLVLGIYPDEVVRLSIQTKGPGSQLCLQEQFMEFAYGVQETLLRVDDYAKVLLDCINGDQTLFWRQDAVELCWGFLTPILENCDCLGKLPLYLYPSGSAGPKTGCPVRQP